MCPDSSLPPLSLGSIFLGRYRNRSRKPQEGVCSCSEILPPEAYHDGLVNVHSHLKKALCTLAVPTSYSARVRRAALLEGEEVIGDEALAAALPALQRQLQHGALWAALLHRIRVQHARQHLHPFHLRNAHVLGRCNGITKPRGPHV